MIKVEKFESVEAALNKLLEANKKYVVIRHGLKREEEIKEHSHDVDEFVVFKEGHFRVGCDGKSKDFDLSNDVRVAFYPKNSKHYLKNLGDKLNYFVIRNLVE